MPNSHGRPETFSLGPLNAVITPKSAERESALHVRFLPANSPLLSCAYNVTGEKIPSTADDLLLIIRHALENEDILVNDNPDDRLPLGKANVFTNQLTFYPGGDGMLLRIEPKERLNDAMQHSASALQLIGQKVQGYDVNAASDIIRQIRDEMENNTADLVAAVETVEPPPQTRVPEPQISAASPTATQESTIGKILREQLGCEDPNEHVAAIMSAASECKGTDFNDRVEITLQKLAPGVDFTLIRAAQNSISGCFKTPGKIL